jgi:class 3 adenylate cyclase
MSSLVTPETRFARTADGTHVAYQVTGNGPVDIVLIRAWYSDMEHEWQEPVLARLFRLLASNARLIRLDRRGLGMSDRARGGAVVTVEERIDDIRAVLDAAGSKKAVIVGLGDACTNCVVFAASHPDRTAGLVLYMPTMRFGFAGDYPRTLSDRRDDARVEYMRRLWGTYEFAAETVAFGAPSRSNDEKLITWFAEQQARAGSAEDAVAMARWFWDTDATTALGAIHVPTLVLGRADAPGIEVVRDAAKTIHGARLVELPGAEPFVLAGDTDAVVREIESFAESIGADASDTTGDNRVLATVLFTDIVDSTAVAAKLGDRSWSEVVERSEADSRSIVERHRGRVIDTAGDGLLASFDGPGRAIRCAKALVEAMADAGLPIRAGLHTGECELTGDRLRGLAVHIGARVVALAGPSEVLVSTTVKDLVAGSGFEFADRGVHALKGVPGEWGLFAVR